jgi:TRAP-type uncharacterized transport system substrate-binding protein
MRRRVFLHLLLASTGLTFGTGHTPYRQWVVYRQRHLLILTSRTDGLSYPLGKRMAEILATHLPASQARVARAPHTQRLASLISTKQLDVALLTRDNAIALRSGQPPFTDYGPVPLQTIVAMGEYLLVCRDDFPAQHAYHVAKTLSLHRADLPIPPDTSHGIESAVPLHPGALAYFQGRSLPDAEAEKQ